MTIINPIPVYPIGFQPVTPVTPFTYRDGATYLDILESLKHYIAEVLVPWIQNELETEQGDVQSIVNDLIEQFNAAVTAMLNGSVVFSDPVMTSIFNNATTTFRTALDATFATKTSVESLETLTTIGRLGESAMHDKYVSALTLPENYGDDATDITALLMERLSEGKNWLKLGSGKFKIKSNVSSLAQSGLHIEGSHAGATELILDQTTSPALAIAGSIGSNINLTANVAFGEYRLTVASTTGMQVGDTLLLGSNAPAVTYSPASVAGSQGELVRIKTVDSATQVSLWGQIRGTYTTTDVATVQIVNMVKGFSLNGMTIRNNKPMQGTYDLVTLERVQNIVIDDVTFDKSDSMAVRLTDCYDGYININAWDQPDTTSGTPPRFGYGVGAYGATENMQINVNATRLRHAFTTGTLANRKGIPRGIVVSGVAKEMTGPAWDTHPGADGIIFDNAYAHSCTHAAFQIRSRNTIVLGGGGDYCGAGVWVTGDFSGSAVIGAAFNHLGGVGTGNGQNSQTLNGGGYGLVLFAEYSSDFTYKDNVHRYVSRSGVLIQAPTTPSAAKKIIIDGNEFIDVGSNGSSNHGIWFNSSITDIVDCVIINNSFTARAADVEPYSGGAIQSAIRVDSTAATSLYAVNNVILPGVVELLGGTSAGNVVDINNVFPGDPLKATKTGTMDAYNSTNRRAISARTTGDNQPRVAMYTHGSVKWGAGNAAEDIELYRPGAKVLILALGGNTAVEYREPDADGKTSLFIRRNTAGSQAVAAVTQGVADSAGTGFRYLRVPN